MPTPLYQLTGISGFVLAADSSDVGKGPLLEDSEISFTGDDFVNVHNRMLVVCGSQAGRSLDIRDVSNGGMAALVPGDLMQFFKLMPGVPHVANPLLGTARVQQSTRVPGSEVTAPCARAASVMQQPPFSAKLVVSLTARNAPVYRVQFDGPLPVDVATNGSFCLANFDRRSGANALLRRNHFHDSCGSGGRIILKALNATFVDNLVERNGGVHIYSEQEWLEGDLGIRNILLRNNTLVDALGSKQAHFDVMKGLQNITCVDSTFCSAGICTTRAYGC